MARVNPRLFDEPDGPAGFRYEPDLIEAAEEQHLIRAIEPLAFAAFEFQGFFGKRKVISFGWRYDFNGGGLERADDIPEFLLRLREAAGRAFGLDAAKLQQVLLTQYPPGAAIGWHKDRSVFGDVVGISLAAACTFRFRRKAGTGWERRSLVLAPRLSAAGRIPHGLAAQHSGRRGPALLDHVPELQERVMAVSLAW